MGDRPRTDRRGALGALLDARATPHPQRLTTGAVAIFLLFAGLLLAAAAGRRWLGIEWTARALLEAGYLAAVPTAIAYSLWDLAMSQGDLPTLGAAANATPILATVAGALYLAVPLHGALLGGAILVAAGALVARSAFRGRLRPRDAAPEARS
ncbi:MAG: EamA family transporter [Candidatus Bipolaricaulota bacterium]|nr:MAG: EamA family transporter [Candidatus Bipolaricaulota bacterium]